MNQVIFRHEAAPLGRTTITAPADAEVVSAVPGSKGWNIYLKHVEPDDSQPAPTKAFEFAAIKTGVPFPAGSRWLATVRGGIHLIEMTASQAKDYDELYPTIHLNESA